MNAARLLPRLQTTARSYGTSSSSRMSARPAMTMRFTARPTLSATKRAFLPHTSRTSSRAYSSDGGRSGGIWSPLFTALLAFGIAATGYGIYDLYGTLTMWPTEVRGDLREALKAKYKADLAMSAAYLQRAWETTKTLPIEHFKSQPHLKTSGIAICLGEVLEGDDKKSEAYDVYVESLKQLQDAGIPTMTGPEKMRAVALAYKLGELGESLEKPKEETEKWLAFAVETVLKQVLQVSPSTSSAGTAHEEGDNMIIIAELGLPDWVSTVDIAAPFEALGTFYSRAGKLDYAMPLMLQAVSILIPPAPQESTPEDKCRGAQLMTSISEMIIRNTLSHESVQQAEQWAMKGLEVVVATRKASKEPIPICEVAYAVQLFNMASIRAIGGDINKAKDLFARTANHAKNIGYQALVETSNQAIEELNSRTAAPKTT
ncbi:hypothetical protein D9756_006584 [Leucocoprinus leucothites]|uniref:Uncharacterized protein n=1 Tax=Leucocoprinus leucothites TaxID=201217 RepID=A0A8H5LGW0_9AGAR|nr:hypothetical protein D9756_006584 [Leucoagaricus leucothites]